MVGQHREHKAHKHLKASIIKMQIFIFDRSYCLAFVLRLLRYCVVLCFPTFELSF